MRYVEPQSLRRIGIVLDTCNNVSTGLNRTHVKATSPREDTYAIDQGLGSVPVVFSRALAVTSRKVAGLFPEQLWLQVVPFLHRLQGGPAAKG